MQDPASIRRIISPTGLLLVVLCFFLPFFSLSCQSELGVATATYTGMDLAFNGVPEVVGAGQSPSPSDLEDMRAGFSPLAIMALLSLVAGMVLGLALPSAFARWLAGASCAAVGLVTAISAQVMAHGNTERGLQQESGGQSLSGLAAASIETHNEAGIWVVAVLLLIVLAYNAAELLVRVNPALAQAARGPTAPPPQAPHPYGHPPPPQGYGRQGFPGESATTTGNWAMPPTGPQGSPGPPFNTGPPQQPGSEPPQAPGRQ